MTTTPRKRKKKKILRINDFDQEKFKQLIWEHKKTFAELNKLKRKGVLHEYDFLFDLKSAVEISAAVFRAGWIACQHVENHRTSHANDKSMDLIKKYIEQAFDV